MKIYKLKAWVNVLIIVFIIDVLLRFSAYIIYPFVYIARNIIRKFRYNQYLKYLAIPLWIYLDDEDGINDYGNELECWNVIGFKPTNWWRKFICAYYWSAIRNPIWNIYSFKFFRGVTLDPYSEIIFDTNKSYIYITEDSELKLNISNSNSIQMLRAKLYYISSDGIKSQSSNEGDYVDLEKSLFGKKLYYFKQSAKWWVLYSNCFLKSLKDNRVKIREINIGAASRVLVRNKYMVTKLNIIN